MWDRGVGDLGLVDCGACIGERGVEKVSLLKEHYG